MSSAISKALYDRLTGDTTLAAFLAQYAGAPAVFTARPVPSDAAMPYLIISPPVTVGRTGTWASSEASRDEDVDLALFAARTGDDDPITDAAERVAALLGAVVIPVEGWARASVRVVNGPLDLPADTDSDGRLVSIRVHLTR